MIEASSSRAPSSFKQAPVPALKRGSSSSASTARCAASSALPPAARICEARIAAARHPSICPGNASLCPSPAPPCSSTLQRPPSAPQLAVAVASLGIVQGIDTSHWLFEGRQPCPVAP